MFPVLSESLFLHMQNLPHETIMRIKLFYIGKALIVVSAQNWRTLLFCISNSAWLFFFFFLSAIYYSYSEPVVD